MTIKTYQIINKKGEVIRELQSDKPIKELRELVFYKFKIIRKKNKDD